MFKLRSFLLGGAALAAMTGVAVAADVPMRNPVFTKAAPAWSWEGQYIGVHGGYFDGSLDLGPGAGINLSPSKGFGGVQFGYLHHLSRNWLIGYYIVEFEQHGKDRAEYGSQLLKKLEERVN